MAISRDRLTAGRVGLRTAARAPQKARSGSGWYAVLARSGLVAKGASYAIVGVLALKLALGDGGKATSRQGALQAIAHHAYGTVLIALLAAGLAAYAIWRFVQAVAEPREDSTAKTWAKRAGYIGRGLIYAGLTYSAVKILVDAGGNQSQNAKAHKTAAAILSWSGGTWIVGILGAAIVVAGLANLYRALSTSFEDNWRAGEMGATARKWAKRIGVAGHLGSHRRDR